MLDLRPQRQWAIKADNTVLEAHLPEDVAAKIGVLLGAGRHTLAETIHRISEACDILRSGSDSSVIVDGVDDLQKLMARLRTEVFVGVSVFNEELRSYKGFCTWVGLHSRHGVYLVDLVRLRAEGRELKAVRFSP